MARPQYSDRNGGAGNHAAGGRCASSLSPPPQLSFQWAHWVDSAINLFNLTYLSHGAAIIHAQ